MELLLLAVAVEAAVVAVKPALIHLEKIKRILGTLVAVAVAVRVIA
jgi:hypothetical protein